MNYTSHYSVLKEECIKYLTEYDNLADKSYFADLTFGGGGHSLALLQTQSNCIVLATDQDPDALENGKEIVEKYSLGDRLVLLDMNFSSFGDYFVKNYSEVIERKGGLQGIIMDLGVSSHHFDQGQRGFSFKFDAGLDMRMNNRDECPLTAKMIINEYDEEKLEKIFSEYGDERFAGRIARKIVEERVNKHIETTRELEDIIFHCYPRSKRFGALNPSTRCFQALRIAVNDELGALERALDQLPMLLRQGGRIAVISFHSLEDRIVKKRFKDLAMNNTGYRILTKKPIIPGERELLENNRSRSAKLRVLEKL